MTWSQGQSVIERLLSAGRLTRVEANRPLADSYLRQARQHLASAALLPDDPEGAFSLAYDAARKSFAAVLVVQGLRPGGAGAHLTLLEAVGAQIDPPAHHAVADFGWMRRLRNSTEYPDTGRKTADNDDVSEAILASTDIVAATARLLDVLTEF